MSSKLNIATAPKTETLQIRINPEIQTQLEMIYANVGMTLTDAINTFLQQSLNAEGLPFPITQDNKELIYEKHFCTGRRCSSCESMCSQNARKAPI